MPLSVGQSIFAAGSLTSANPPAQIDTTLDGAASDAVVNVMMISGDPAGRAQVICDLLDEMMADVTSLQSEGFSAAESSSLQNVRNAAYEHCRRMSMLRVGHGADPAAVADMG